MASWSSPNLFLSILLLLISIQHSTSEPTKDTQALLDFINKIPHCRRIQWNTSISACNWSGVVCDCSHSYVAELNLTGACPIGTIPPNTLSRLSKLHVLSLRNTSLNSPLPSDFSNLTSLRCIDLSNNSLSGVFPPLFTLTRLIGLDLSSNNFSGPIPPDLNNLSRLRLLRLEHNKFSGKLPHLNLPELTDFNVSTNNLAGLIPRSLRRFRATAFKGNLLLYGPPLIVADLSNRKLSTAQKVTIAIASAVFFLILLLRILFLIFRQWRDQTSRSRRKHVPAAAGTSSSKDDMTTSSAEEVERRNPMRNEQTS